MKIYIKVLVYCLIALTINSCSKDTFLDAKPSTNFTNPTTIEDFQSLLANPPMLEIPALGEGSADNYYIIILPEY